VEVQTDLALDLLVLEVPLAQDQFEVLLEDHLVDHLEVQNLLAWEVLEVILHYCSLEAEAGVH